MAEREALCPASTAAVSAWRVASVLVVAIIGMTARVATSSTIGTYGRVSTD